MVNVLGRCKKGVEVSVPTRMDDGTVEVFTARLREEIDLAALSEELLAVVDQTMEPTQATLWLRPSTERM